MFGNKPKHKDLTGQQEDDKLYGRYGKMIEDKLSELEHKLTKQMLCSHESYSVVPYDSYPLATVHMINIGHVRSMEFGYRKICDGCGISLGLCGYEAKRQRDYEIAKQKVEEFEKSQLKEPEELPAEATEFRGDFSAIRAKMRDHKIENALGRLKSAERLGNESDELEALVEYTSAICDVIDILQS